MMAEYIERQAAIDVLEERLQANGYSNVALVSELNRSIGYLMRLPSVDAVPVVRCKDCKYYGRVDKRRFYRGSDCLNGHIDTIVPDRDFCSRGERQDG